MFLGIDVGTSGVKAVIIAPSGAVLAQASAPLTVLRPAPLWSEQDPDDWVRATEAECWRLTLLYALPSLVSALPDKCTAPPCLAQMTGRCALPFCGTTVAALPNAQNLS